MLENKAPPRTSRVPEIIAFPEAVK